MPRHEGDGETHFSVSEDVLCVESRGQYLDFLDVIALADRLLARLYCF